MKYWKLFLASIVGLLLALSAQASLIMPDFAGVPAGWVTDRYDPNSFTNVGTYQGRDNVLGIGISEADGFNNRTGGYQNIFYNTQGKQHAATGGVGSILAADLYIPAAWRDGSNGSVRTDMWGVMTDGTAVSDYTIIGFTNYGGAARLRVWDDVAWVDLTGAIAFDDWTSFAIEFTGSAYDYLVNGVSVYTDLTINGTTGFTATIMQDYNFCDPNLPGAVCSDYMTRWDNAQTSTVPEPGSFPLIAMAILALGSIRLLGRRGSQFAKA